VVGLVACGGTGGTDTTRLVDNFQWSATAGSGTVTGKP
jgi:hypothetical protein